MKHFRLVVIIALAGLLVSSCTTLTPPDGKTANVNAIYPILLVHGFGGKAGVWEDAGTVEYLQDRGLSYGGEIQTDGRGNAKVIRNGRQRTGDFYTVSISDPYQSMEFWVDEIGTAVEYARRKAGTPLVTLFGMSAGGVASRAYLVDNINDHNVARLITLASPHTGTELARLAGVKKDVLDRDGLRWAESIIDKIESQLGFPLDAPILEQLKPEEHNPWLQDLNAADHPLDVQYTSIVVSQGDEKQATSGLVGDIERLLKNPAKSSIGSMVMNQVLGALNKDGWTEGDGVVLAERQRLSQVAFFRDNDIITEEISSFTPTHLDAKKQHPAIFDALGSNVAFREAHYGENATILMDFEHGLPGLSIVEAASRRTGEDLKVSRVKVLQNQDDRFARVVIGPIPEDQVGPIDVFVSQEGSADYFVTTIVSSGSNVDPFVPDLGDSKPFTVHVERVSGIPNEEFDKLTITSGPAADVFATVTVAGKQLAKTRTVNDVEEGEVTWDEPLTIPADPLRNTVRIEIWDADPPLTNDLMDWIEFGPGELPNGDWQWELGTGMLIDVTIDWTPRPGYFVAEQLLSLD